VLKMAWDSYSYGGRKVVAADRVGLELELRHPHVLAGSGRRGGLLVMLAEHAHDGRRRRVLAFLQRRAARTRDKGRWRLRTAAPTVAVVPTVATAARNA